METPMAILIIGVAIVLYILGALRVLRQYERGVVFLLGKFEVIRPDVYLLAVPADGAGVAAHRHDADPPSQRDHHQG